MDEETFQVAKARALALCREAAAMPIPVDDALAYLNAKVAECEEERFELEGLAALFMAIGAFQEIGAQLLPERSPGITVPRPGGSAPVPLPSNVR